MTFEETDGGRWITHLAKTPDVGECVVRAVTIAQHRLYTEVYSEIDEYCKYIEPKGVRKKFGGSSGAGVHCATVREYFKALGFRWVPLAQFGNPKRYFLNSRDLPRARLIVSMREHVAAVLYHTLYDTYDCRGKCVYGYWVVP